MPSITEILNTKKSCLQNVTRLWGSGTQIPIEKVVAIGPFEALFAPFFLVEHFEKDPPHSFLRLLCKE